jgi:hypothetical protein
MQGKARILVEGATLVNQKSGSKRSQDSPEGHHGSAAAARLFAVRRSQQ